MSTIASRSVTLQSTGDIEYTQEFDSAQNSASPAFSELIDLSSGNNTITVPSGTTGVTIIPPSANVIALILKGVNGDTGIAIALASPTSIGLLSVSSFVLNAASALTGLRIIFS